MSHNSIPIEVLTHEKPEDITHELALSVLEGLSESPKRLPSRLFYDDRGSDLFKQIMTLGEYYPTHSETEILTDNSNHIIKNLDVETFNLIELGCGDGAKTILLLDAILNTSSKFKFAPMDISKAAVDFLIGNLKAKYDQIPFSVQGLVAEYFEGLRWLNKNTSQRNFVLFLGSNIGNFNKPVAMRFLRQLWYALNDGDLALIGFDLKKDLDVLYDAYNDSKGVTKEFNFNVIDRINKMLGGNFERQNFQHQGLYNIQTGAMESYLISQKEHVVEITELGKTFKFQPWEPIHMEYSYKYLESDIEELATGTGFEIIENIKDSKEYFVDSIWKVKK